VNEPTLVIAIAVSMICMWGTLVGSILPMLFKRMGFAPAVACSPFIATCSDVTGIVIFFTVARLGLSNLHGLPIWQLASSGMLTRLK
jgi:magnesium transporter